MSEPALRPGDLLSDRYEIRSFLGRGGMGMVYEAWDRELGVAVALKTLPPDAARDEVALRRLKREVLLARQVTHPNVCRLHDLWRDQDRGLLFATMELLRGETLSVRLSRTGPLAPDRALLLVVPMARALDAAHLAGVVHGDFKSGNVMLVPDPSGAGAPERVVLTDFGLACPRAADGSGATGSGPIEGTPAYMAPEQLRGERAGSAADLYALGIVLYRMVTGRLPFEGDDEWAAALRRLSEDPPSPRRHAPDLPATWEHAILRSLARRPEERFGSAGEVAAALAGETEVAGARVRAPGRLPVERDAFVARGSDLAALARRIEDGSRLVTVLGAAGTGKTRLALHYAGRTRGDWPGGVWFCSLAEARNRDGIASAVATALDVPLGGEDPIVQLGHAIAGRGRGLFLLDNFEQVVGEAETTLGAWHARAPEASFLVTSRERIHLAGEDVLDLGPLGEDDGTELFLMRARSHRPGFELGAGELEEVRRIVRRLDGLPLAIELAAARVRLMTPPQIAEKLSDRFHLLAGGETSGRHATLRAAIDGSWELLRPWEKAAFAQCSVFEGGFTLDAAEAVFDLSAWPEAPWVVDAVQSLLDKSVLRLERSDGGDGEPRCTTYVSLQEYARGKLGEADARSAEERHGRYFARFGADEAIEGLNRHGGSARRRALDRELENLAAACRRAVRRGEGATAMALYRAAWEVLDSRGPVTVGVELGRSVLALGDSLAEERGPAARLAGVACLRAGLLEEAREHFDLALGVARAAGNRRLEGAVLGSLGGLHVERGRMDEGREHHGRALAIHREIGNRRAVGIALGNLGLLHMNQGRMEEAREHYEQALAILREVGDRRFEGVGLGDLGNLHSAEGRMEEAREHYEQALAIHREVGHRRYEGMVLGHLGNLHKKRGLMEEAREDYERALAIAREVGDRRYAGAVLGNLGNLHLQQGRMEEAREHYGRALAIDREVGNRRSAGFVLQNLGLLHFEQGRMEEAREHYECALAIHRELGNRGSEGRALGNLGALDARAGAFESARAAFGAGARQLRDAGDKFALGVLLCARGEAELLSGDLAAAGAALDEAASLAVEVAAGRDSALDSAVTRLRETLEARERSPE